MPTLSPTKESNSVQVDNSIALRKKCCTCAVLLRRVGVMGTPGCTAFDLLPRRGTSSSSSSLVRTLVDSDSVSFSDAECGALRSEEVGRDLFDGFRLYLLMKKSRTSVLCEWGGAALRYQAGAPIRLHVRKSRTTQLRGGEEVAVEYRAVVVEVRIAWAEIIIGDNLCDELSRRRSHRR